MVLKVIEATQAKAGAVILIENEPYTVLSNDKSKTGKHGAAKCRIECKGIYHGKKKIIAVNGGEKFDVPLIEKRKAQILSFEEKSASVMDLESYETIDVPFGEELKNDIAVEKQVEYWDIEGVKKIMRVI